MVIDLKQSKVFTRSIRSRIQIQLHLLTFEVWKINIEIMYRQKEYQFATLFVCNHSRKIWNGGNFMLVEMKI